jgi:hypothetical protein
VAETVTSPERALPSSGAVIVGIVVGGSTANAGRAGAPIAAATTTARRTE